MVAVVEADTGWDNPLAVFITLPDVEWDAGTDINITVLVFREGAPHDPDDVDLSIITTERELNLTREGTGVYYVVYTVMAADLDEDGSLLMAASVEDGTGLQYETALDHMFLPGEGAGFIVATMPTDPSDQYPRPGDTIELAIWTLYELEPVDPDDGSLEVVVHDEDDNLLPVTIERVERGHHVASFDIPDHITVSESFSVEVEAEYTTGTGTLDGGDMFDVYVQLFDVWVRRDVTESRTEMDLWVLGTDGTAMAGVDVHLNFSYFDDAWEYVDKTLGGTTDADGKVPFTLSYDGLAEDEHCIDVQITVGVGQDTVEMGDEIIVREHTGSSGSDGFEVGVPEDPLPPESEVTLDMVASYDGDPMRMQEILVYIVDDHQVLHSGSARTASDGSFSVTFNTPATSEGGIIDVAWIELFFQTQHLATWSSTGDLVVIGDMAMGDDIRDYVDPTASISVDAFEAGSDAQLTFTSDHADGNDEIAYAMCVPGSFGDYAEHYLSSDRTPEWGRLSEYSSSPDLGFTSLTWSDGSYMGSMYLPPFIPPEEDLTFIGVLMEGQMLIWEFSTAEMYVAYKEGVHALPANTPPEVTITAPEEGEQYGGLLMVEGTASDDDGVLKVEHRIDAGPWSEVSGNESWSMELDTTALESGTHQLEVRAWDGKLWSPVEKVVFESDQPPVVEMTPLISNLSLHGIVTFMGLASDDNEVERVEFRVDEGAWFRATGTEEWSFQLNTSMFIAGAHKLFIRASDGERSSLEFLYNFTIDQLPMVTIRGHVGGAVYKDKVEFEGEASDDVAVVSIEVRVDGGEWVDIGFGADWEYRVPTEDLDQGEHTFDVRAWDAEKHSGVTSTTFRYEGPGSPGFGVLAALLATLMAVPLAWWRMGKGR